MLILFCAVVVGQNQLVKPQESVAELRQQYEADQRIYAVMFQGRSKVVAKLKAEADSLQESSEERKARTYHYLRVRAAIERSNQKMRDSLEALRLKLERAERERRSYFAGWHAHRQPAI